MGLSKTEQFESSEVELAALAKALAHPARIRIMKTLTEHRNCVCGEIVENLGLAQSTVSQHLKAMKDAGVIKGVATGKTTCYCIDTNRFTALYNSLNALLKNASNCC